MLNLRASKATANINWVINLRENKSIKWLNNVQTQSLKNTKQQRDTDQINQSSRLGPPNSSTYTIPTLMWIDSMKFQRLNKSMSRSYASFWAPRTALGQWWNIMDRIHESMDKVIRVCFKLTHRCRLALRKLSYHWSCAAATKTEDGEGTK